MTYKQLNKENIGVDAHTIIPMGYRHADGMVFNDAHPAWKEIHKFFEILSKDILKIYPQAKKILDLGSGAGNFRYTLLEHNPELLVISIDGNPDTINSPLIDMNKHFILRTDVDYTIVDENNEILKFDIIGCFEHFEHIERQFFDIFISNMKKHSHSETILIASAANYEFGSSHVHCNVKNLSQWDEELTYKYGMKKIDIPILNKNNFGSRMDGTSELHYKIYG